MLHKRSYNIGCFQEALKVSPGGDLQNYQENTSVGISFLVKLRPATLLKKRFRQRCFPVNFAKFLRTAFLIEHQRWLLLFVGNNESFLLYDVKLRTCCLFKHGKICSKLTKKGPAYLDFLLSKYHCY